MIWRGAQSGLLKPQRLSLRSKQRGMFAMGSAFFNAPSGPAAPTWRYWRLYTTANNGDASLGIGYAATSIYGFVLAASTGGPTLLTSGMAYNQSDEYSGATSFSAACTALGTAGYWATSGSVPAPWWATVDCGSSISPVECRMACENISQGPARAPNTFQIQGSSDGTTWNTVKSFSGVNSWVQGAAKSFALI